MNHISSSASGLKSLLKRAKCDLVFLFFVCFFVGLALVGSGWVGVEWLGFGRLPTT